MSNTAQEYAIYYTAAVGGIAAGTVWNRVVWDGVTTWSPPSGSSAVLDGANQYPIGSTYTAGAS